MAKKQSKGRGGYSRPSRGSSRGVSRGRSRGYAKRGSNARSNGRHQTIRLVVETVPAQGTNLGDIAGVAAQKARQAIF